MTDEGINDLACEYADCVTLPTDSFYSVMWQSEPKKVKIEIHLLTNENKSI